jgi:hypothetical protein
MKGLAAKLLIIITALLLTLTTGAATLALSAEIIVDRNSLAVGDSLQLQVSVAGSTSATPPRFKAVGGLQIVYHGPSTSVQIINGRVSASTTFNYSALATQTGTYSLGPLTVKAGGKTIQTNRVQVTVTAAATPPVPAQQSAPAQIATDPSDPVDSQLKKRLFLTMDLPRTSFYSGETVKTTIRLYTGGIEIQDVHYPTIKAADGCQVEIGKPTESRRNLNGIQFKVVEFPTTISFIKTGHLQLGPATLECNALVQRRSNDSFFDDFFNNYEQYPQSLASKSFQVTIKALPPPPAGFSGGIGRFSLAATAMPQEVLAGDPITVQATVTGRGNLASIGAPTIGNATGLKVYDAQRKTTKKEAGFGNKALFEQIIFPLKTQVTAIGPYSLVYFDPEQGRYQTARAAAIPVKVKPNPNFNLSVAGKPVDSASNQLGQGLVYIKDTPGRLRLKNAAVTRQIWFWLLQLLPLAAIGGAFFFRRYQEQQNSDTPLARALRADRHAGKALHQISKLLENSAYDEYLDELHRIFREYLADKFHLTAGGITGSVTNQLAATGVAETTLQNIAAFFEQYDRYRFTGAKLSKADTAQLTELVVTVITANRQLAKNGKKMGNKSGG